MPVVFSTIHAALGQVGPLDLSMLTQAISEGVSEDDHLDWKQALPTDAEEFAKDVSALANSRGGLLVFGVAEQRGTGRATSALPVDLAERHQRKLRSWLATRISPAIAGVEMIALPTDGADGSIGFLVVSVPESPDAPHLVGADNALGAPYRMGAQTFWMREWDLERAYQQRFAHRSSEEDTLAALIDHVGDQLDLSSGCWLVGASLPSVKWPHSTSGVERQEIVALMQESVQAGARLCRDCERRAALLRSLDNVALNPRVGLRRWVMADHAVNEAGAPSDRVHVEVHDDGAVLIATRVDGWHRESIEGKHCLPPFMVSGLAVDLVALASTSAQMRGQTGQLLLRVDMLRNDSAPFAILSRDRTGPVQFGMRQPGWTRDVHRFLPVHAVAEVGYDEESWRHLVELLARDVVAQFGMQPDGIEW